MRHGQSEYLGEDGEWYWYFTGSDGVSYNMTHVFYATEQDHLNIAKIQSVRSCCRAFLVGSFLPSFFGGFVQWRAWRTADSDTLLPLPTWVVSTFLRDFNSRSLFL